MKKLIELDAAIEAMMKLQTEDIEAYGASIPEGFDGDRAVAALKALPSVDAVPAAHSEWIPKEKADTPYGLEMECAKCGFSVIVNDALYFNFFPNCGAKMDGKEGRSNEQRGEKAQKGTGAGAPEAEDQGAGAQL